MKMQPETALDFTIDPLMKVSSVREWLVVNKVFERADVPTHQTIINYILIGKLKGHQHDNGTYGVRKSSLIAWAKSLQEDTI